MLRAAAGPSRCDPLAGLAAWCRDLERGCDRVASGRGVVRREEAGGRLVAVGGGGHAERGEQYVEAPPDRGRERAAAADPPGLRQLRLRGCTARLRPSGLDAVAALEHVANHGRGRYVLADYNGGRDILGQVDHQPGVRAVAELIGDPSAAPPRGIRVRVGDDPAAQSVARAGAAEVDTLVDALRHQAADVTERVEVDGR